MNYAGLSIKKIQDVNVLSNDDSSFVVSIKNEIERCHNIHQKWRSEFIIRNAVLTQQKHPLNSSKYFQAIREELVFFSELVRHSLDYERCKLNKEKIQLRINAMGDSEMERVDKKLLQLDMLGLDVKMLEVKRDSRERVRELRIWEKVKSELDNGSFDINDPELSQKEHWVTRWKNDIAVGQDMMNPTIYRHALGHLQTFEDSNETS